MSRDVMKQALEVLSLELPIGSHIELKNALRAAIKQTNDWDEVEALRESLREHMAEIHRLRAAIEQAQGKHEDWCASLTQLLLSMPPKPAPCNCKPRTAPPRQWQGLTDEDRDEILRWVEWKMIGNEYVAPQKIIAYVEKKLKEKNNAR